MARLGRDLAVLESLLVEPTQQKEKKKAQQEQATGW